MRKIFKKLAFFFVAILSLTVSSSYSVKEVRAAEETYSYTFTGKQFSANGTKTLGDVDWTLAGNGGYWGYDGTKGQQFGSSGNPYKSMTFSTSHFNDKNIKEVVINTSGASSVNASFIVKVGVTQLGSSTKLTTSATNYTFTPTQTVSGDLVFTYTQTSSKAIYIKSISVTYNTSGSSEPETPIYSLSLSAETTTIKVGDEPLLITPSTEYPNPTYTWESSNPEVATVSNGYVTPLTVGTTSITATIIGTDIESTLVITVAEDGDYVLVTNNSQLKIGNKVIIAVKDDDYAMSTNQKTNNREAVSVIKNNNKLEFSENLQILTLENGNVNSTYAFNTGDGYLYAASSGSNHLKTKADLDDNGSWSISISSDGTASIIAQGSNTRNMMLYNYNGGSPLISCYSELGDYKQLCIYKFMTTTEQEEAEKTPSLNITSSSSLDLFVSGKGGESSSIITYTYSNLDVNNIVWEFSENNIASFDSLTNTVTAVNEGATELSAKYNEVILATINITVKDYCKEIDVSDYINLNTTTVSNLPSLSTVAGQTFIVDNVNYGANYVYKYNSNISFAKNTTANLFNFNKYKSSITQIVVQSDNFEGLSILESTNGIDFSNVEAQESSIYNGSTNINVNIYDFNANSYYFKIEYTGEKYINISNIWIEFVERYTVSFDVNGGSDISISSFNVRSGETIITPTTSRVDAEFMGWKNNEETIQGEINLIVNKNINYVASWKETDPYSLVSTKANLEFGYTYDYEESLEPKEFKINSSFSAYDETDYASNFGVSDKLEVKFKKYNCTTGYTAVKASEYIRLYRDSNKEDNGGALVISGKNVNITKIEFVVDVQGTIAEGAHYLTVTDNTGGINYIDSDNDTSISFGKDVNSFEIQNTSNVERQDIEALKVYYSDKAYKTFNKMNIGLFADISNETLNDAEVSSAGFVVTRGAIDSLVNGMTTTEFNTALGSTMKNIPVGDSYITKTESGISFSAKITNVPERHWDTEFTYVAYVVVGDNVYFINSKTCSVKSLAQEYITKATNEEISLSASQLSALQALVDYEIKTEG